MATREQINKMVESYITSKGVKPERLNEVVTEILDYVDAKFAEIDSSIAAIEAEVGIGL